MRLVWPLAHLGLKGGIAQVYHYLINKTFFEFEFEFEMIQTQSEPNAKILLHACCIPASIRYFEEKGRNENPCFRSNRGKLHGGVAYIGIKSWKTIVFWIELPEGDKGLVSATDINVNACFFSISVSYSEWLTRSFILQTFTSIRTWFYANLYQLLWSHAAHVDRTRKCVAFFQPRRFVKQSKVYLSKENKPVCSTSALSLAYAKHKVCSMN